MSANGTSTLGSRLIVAGLANLMTWIAIHSWNGIVERPLEFTGPALTAALLITVTGALLRGLRLAAVVVLLLQVVVVGVWFFHHQNVSDYAGGWIPTPDGIAAIADQVRSGASAINTYLAPVRAARVTAPMYLLALALLLMLAVDLIAAGMRRPTWAGLPILIALTVPISVLSEGLHPAVFVGTAVCFVMLLAAVENERVLAWGQAVTGRKQRGDGTDAVLDRASAQGPALRIGLVATTAALVLPIFVPLSPHGLDDGPASGSGRGPGEPVTLRNPMANLHRDLVRQDRVPLLEARTNSPDPTYLRTTVLDTFTGSAWIPGDRDLPATNRAEGRMPDPAGFVSSTAGVTSDWSLSTTAAFLTSWLPAPFVTRSINVDEGDWRYDLRTLDLASTDEDPPSPVTYQLTGFAPVYDPAKLAAAPSAPKDVVDPMTKVPRLTAKVTRIAREVTAAATTDYAKVVALQDWFRRNGGFRYSLQQGPGDGMRQLERFITTDKSGYCEQFAAAMAVMTRALGIPARVVVGFLEPTQVSKGFYRYTSNDLHAWPEVYFSGTGWVRFEPTPSSRTGAAPPWSRADAPVRTPTQPTAAPSTATPSAGPSRKPDEVGATADSTGPSSTTWLRLAVGLLVLGALAVPALLRRAQRRRRFSRRGDERLEVENLWQELHATAIDLRLRWPEGRSPRETGRLLCHRVSAGPDHAAQLDHLVGVVEQARYRERFTLDEETRSQCQATVATWIEVLTDASPARRARMARVLPRSVLSSMRQPEPGPAAATAESSSLTEVG